MSPAKKSTVPVAIAFNPKEQGLFSKKVKRLAAIQKKKGERERENRGIVKITHLPYGFFEEGLTGFFSQFGQVTRVRVARSAKTGNSMGYGYVEFRYREVAEIAAESMNNYLMYERLIKCELLDSEVKTGKIFLRDKMTKDDFPKKRRREETLSEEKRPLSATQITKFLESKKKKVEKHNEKMKSLGITYSFTPPPVREPALKKEKMTPPAARKMRKSPLAFLDPKSIKIRKSLTPNQKNSPKINLPTPKNKANNSPKIETPKNKTPQKSMGFSPNKPNNTTPKTPQNKSLEISTPKSAEIEMSKSPKEKTPKQKTPQSNASFSMGKTNTPKTPQNNASFSMGKTNSPKTPQNKTPKSTTPQTAEKNMDKSGTKITPKIKTPKVKTPEIKIEIKTPKGKTHQIKSPKEKTPKEKTPQVKSPKEKTPKFQTPSPKQLKNSPKVKNESVSPKQLNKGSPAKKKELIKSGKKNKKSIELTPATPPKKIKFSPKLLRSAARKSGITFSPAAETPKTSKDVTKTPKKKKSEKIEVVENEKIEKLPKFSPKMLRSRGRKSDVSDLHLKKNEEVKEKRGRKSIR